MAVLEPFLTLKLVESLKYGFCADSVRSVRVCKVSGYIDLVRLYFLEQVYYYINVGLCPFAFFDSSGLIERKVEEMCVRIVVQSE